jgi:hypothetical protein
MLILLAILLLSKLRSAWARAVSKRCRIPVPPIGILGTGYEAVWGRVIASTIKLTQVIK